MQTLVERCRDVRVCQKHQVLDERSEVVDRKLDLLVGELKKYGVPHAGLQESRWLGMDVWPVADGYTFLSSGRPLPGDGEKAATNAGVGLLLDVRAPGVVRKHALVERNEAE